MDGLNDCGGTRHAELQFQMFVFQDLPADDIKHIIKCRNWKALPPRSGLRQHFGRSTAKLFGKQGAIGQDDFLQKIRIKRLRSNCLERMGKIAELLTGQGQPCRHCMPTESGNQSRMAGINQSKCIPHMESENRAAGTTQFRNARFAGRKNKYRAVQTVLHA